MSNIGANQTFLSRRTVKSHRHGGTAEREINLEMNEVLRGWAEKSVVPTTLSSLYIFKIYFRPTLN